MIMNGSVNTGGFTLFYLRREINIRYILELFLLYITSIKNIKSPKFDLNHLPGNKPP